jgi:hypothetical protein
MRRAGCSESRYWTFTKQDTSERSSCMSLFTTPTTAIEPPSRTALVVPLLIGAAIFLAYALSGQLDTAFERVPVALVGGGAFALGGVVGWLWRWSRARRSAASPRPLESGPGVR